ncbi:MAG TPA: class I SAM-dependent methyltransferase [Vicinamibacterales bacterium]
MTTDDRGSLDSLDRARRDADRRYNESLTALDAAVIAADGHELTRADFDRVATALIVFLQQITAFVESKDRQVAGGAGARLDTVDRSLEAVSELRTQVGVLQRTLEALRRSAGSQQTAGGGQPPAGVGEQSTIPSAPPPGPSRDSASPIDEDLKYVGFEDQFRGSDEAIADRLRAYLPIFEGRSNVLDVGCGRGEFLVALKTAGISARGIDTNAEMVAVARDRGLDTTHTDAVSYLQSLADASLGGLIATQVIEHLEPRYLMKLLDEAAQKLRPGAPIVLETINVACWLAFFSSYMRDFTHVRPVHPETLQYLARASGFERVEIRYSAPVPDTVKMKTVDLPAEVLTSTDPTSTTLARIAHTINANAVVLNNLMFTHLDYAIIGYRI